MPHLCKAVSTTSAVLPWLGICLGGQMKSACGSDYQTQILVGMQDAKLNIMS